jgi:hypothetical protein
MFSLIDKVTKQRNSFFQSSSPVNEDLPLSKELTWQNQSVYRTCHYDPAILALYLRESLQVVAPMSTITYLGENSPTLEAVQRMWTRVSPSGVPVRDLRDVAARGERVIPDALLVDCYFQRSEYWETRIRLVQEQAQRRLERGRVTKEEAAEATSSFANTADYKAWRAALIPLWDKLLPSVRLRRGVYVILLGCLVGDDLYATFKGALTKSLSFDGDQPNQKESRAAHPRVTSALCPSSNRSLACEVR